MISNSFIKRRAKRVDENLELFTKALTALDDMRSTLLKDTASVHVSLLKKSISTRDKLIDIVIDFLTNHKDIGALERKLQKSNKGTGNNIKAKLRVMYKREDGYIGEMRSCIGMEV